MTDEEIKKLVRDLSKSWRGRFTHDTSQFEQDMIVMCKEVRDATILNQHQDLYFKEHNLDLLTGGFHWGNKPMKGMKP